MEDLARAELAACGAQEVRATSAGLSFRGDLEVAYRVCLWSRLASRVLLSLATVPAGSSAELHEALRELPWEEHLDPGGTLAVDAHARGDRAINTHFIALKTKDAIVDRLRDVTGRRPSVDLVQPSLRVHVLVQGGSGEASAQVSLDLSGEALHRRGYRRDAGPAPLKENVAAALLLRAGWPATAAAGGALVDPMCGAGTLLVEGAWIAGDVAPGLLRQTFGFSGWLQHRPATWRRLRAEAEERREAGRARPVVVAGGDLDAVAVRHAGEHLRIAGVTAAELLVRDVGAAAPPPGATTGLVAVNPPYGERLGSPAEMPALYRRLGEAMKARFAGWTLALLTTDARLAGEVRMRPSRRNALWNGPLRCELLQYRMREEVTPPRGSGTAGA